MNGKIKKILGFWYVEMQHYDRFYDVRLHPDDVANINELSETFDNVEARVLSNPIVEFELEVVKTDSSFIEYAKLKSDSGQAIEQNIMPQGGLSWDVNALNWFVEELKKLNEAYPQIFKSGFDTFEYYFKLDDLIKKAKELNGVSKA